MPFLCYHIQNHPSSDNYMSTVAFSDIQKKFGSVNGSLTDAERFDLDGKVDIWVSEFMNTGVAYILYSCNTLNG